METKKLKIGKETKHKKKKIKKFFKEVEEMAATETEEKVIGVVEKCVLAVAAFMQHAGKH